MPDVAEPALASALPRLCYQFQNGERSVVQYEAVAAGRDIITTSALSLFAAIAIGACMILSRHGPASSLARCMWLRAIYSSNCRAGPWRGLWIHRGYDPRRAKAGEERRLARSYQVVELKVLPAKCGSLSSAMPPYACQCIVPHACNRCTG